MININYPVAIKGNVVLDGVKLGGSISSSAFKITGKVEISGGGGEIIPNYLGPYTVTPTQYTQILSTENKKATQDIVINPIPSNYGLITWNGSFLTVS